MKAKLYLKKKKKKKGQQSPVYFPGITYRGHNILYKAQPVCVCVHVPYITISPNSSFSAA